jgi:uncharacterized membrane protein
MSFRGERAGGTGTDPGGTWSLVLATLPNDRVGDFVEALSGEAEDAQVILLPLGALPMSTPLDELDDRAQDVSRLSTMEIVIASLQSVGAWRGLLIYSALAGFIGGYALLFDVSYLLVAAMLVNPMGAPALVAVIGMTVGDARMFGRGGLRFLVSLLTQALAALSLGLAYGISVSTPMMEQITALSAWAAALALAAGAAGAQTQVKSERDSLVSGTAAGFMVAAALAPPAAVLGLSIPLGRWDYAGLMAFLLTLQFFAIAAGGWLVLHFLGVRPGQPSIGRGSASVRTGLAAVVVAVTVGLVVWQTHREPTFLKADLSSTALEIVRDAVEATPGTWLVESSARFTRPQLEVSAGEALLLEIVVQRDTDAAESGIPADAALEAGLRERVSRSIQQRMVGVVPFVRVVVLPGLPAPQQ